MSMIDKSSLYADKYKSNRQALEMAVLGRGSDNSIDPYTALRALQKLKLADKYEMMQQAMSGQQAQNMPSLVEQAVQPQQGLGAMAPQMQPQGQPAPQEAQEQPQSAGLESMPFDMPSMAGGGIVAFAGDEEDNDERTGQLVQSAGHPSSYNYFANSLPVIMQRMAEAKFEPMTDAAYDKRTKRELELYREAMGPSPYEGYQKQLGEMDADRVKGLEQAKGLAALQAIGPMLQGNNAMRGFGAAASAFGGSYEKALAADNAEKRALMTMRMNLQDAQRKENMGLFREARGAADNAQRSWDAAQKFKIDKLKALGSVAASGARATRPVGGAGGAGKVKLPEMLAAAEIEFEKNPSAENQARVDALRRAVTLARTSDMGPTRAGAAEYASNIQEQKLINEALSKARISPEYLEARTEADRQRILKSARENARVQASRNPKAIPINDALPEGFNLDR